MEQWVYQPALSGTPQGGIASPLLANIYLDQLDRARRTDDLPGLHQRAGKKRLDPEYVRLCKQRSLAKGKGDMATYRELGRVLAKMPSQVSTTRLPPPQVRPLRRRLPPGFRGTGDGKPRRSRPVSGHLPRDHLKLELSPDKTLITHAATEKARFLGYEITT